MVEYKKQHWLPACYLKQWSHEGKDQGRKSRVWVCGKDRKGLAIVENECAKSYCYDEEYPKAAEEQMQMWEGSYMKYLDNLSRSQPAEIQKLGWLNLLVHFHARNTGYKNHSSDLSNIEAYKSLQTVILLIALGIKKLPAEGWEDLINKES